MEGRILFIDPGLSFDLYIFTKEKDLLTLSTRTQIQAISFDEILKLALEFLKDKGEMSECIVLDNICHDAESIVQFFSKERPTFQFKKISLTNKVLNELIDNLKSNNMKEGRFEERNLVSLIGVVNSVYFEQKMTRKELTDRSDLVKRLVNFVMKQN